MSPPSPDRRGRTVASFDALAHLSFAALAALLLVAAAQPVQTDDVWWHLALGRAYANEGPWLETDPLLHTAVGPPAPAAWLSDGALHAISRIGGFHALRALHALALTSILALVWSSLRRASGSSAFASLASGAVIALSAYRLYQLRPELASILATLLFFRLLLDVRKTPSWRRVALAVALLGVWANAHGGFLVAPILLAAAIAGLLFGAAIGPSEARRRDLERARRLAAALALGLVATLANPVGIDAHLSYLRAGEDTPDLALVTDEWARVALFELPVANLPPSPLAWALVWGLLLLAPTAVGQGALLRRRRGAEGVPDPALAGVALASLAAMLLAVRFLWLGFFPLLLLAQWLAMRGPRTRSTAIVTGIAAALLVPAFVRMGDWPMVSRTLRSSWGDYAEPYLAAKYHATAVGVLADAGLEGRLYNDYFLGGFLGYWLAPRIRSFVNGSLNLPREALADHAALLQRRGGQRGEGFLELLDRYDVDIFFGIRLPQVPKPNRTWIYTAAHLEGAPGWIPIFRDLQTGVYLRANERNRANLARIAAYYAREGVPFDPERGFDAAAVLRAAPGWAIAHALAPADLASIEADALGADPARRRQALDRLASLHVALGAYDEAIALDRQLLRAIPGAKAPTRRLVWSLLRLGRAEEANAVAGALRRPRADAISASIAAAAMRAATRGDAVEPAALLARVPVFTRAEASLLVAGVEHPPTRALRK